jgi:uncharacterized protein (UPF0332 family)
MPDPAELLAVARLLSDTTTRPSDAQLRRAISTAYYALFHRVVRIAANRFMGPGCENSAGFSLIYRSFDHGRMRQVCESLDKPTLAQAQQRQLGRTAVSQDMRNFAQEFYVLQEARHQADYDPSFSVEPSDVLGLISEAEAGLAALDRADPEERADVLALMMVPKPRA